MASLKYVPDEWINGRQAGLITGRSPCAIQRAALLGLIRVMQAPGQSIHYHRGDVSRWATEQAGCIPRKKRNPRVQGPGASSKARERVTPSNGKDPKAKGGPLQ